LRIFSGATGLNQDLAITAITPASGTLTFGTATAPVNNVSAYAILPAITQVQVLIYNGKVIVLLVSIEEDLSSVFVAAQQQV
jgi:hypothetical protein